MRVATIVRWRCGPATGVGLMLPGLLAVLAVLAALAALAVLTARLGSDDARCPRQQEQQAVRHT